MLKGELNPENGTPVEATALGARMWDRLHRTLFGRVDDTAIDCVSAITQDSPAWRLGRWPGRGTPRSCAGLVHVPGFAVGGDAVAGLGDQPGERTQQHTTGRTSHGAMRVGDRHLAVRTRHVNGEGRHLLDARAVTQVSADRHTREQVRGDDRAERIETRQVNVVEQDVRRGVAEVDTHTQRPRETNLVTELQGALELIR